MKKLTYVFLASMLFISTDIFTQGVEINAGMALNNLMSDQQHIRGKPGLTAGARYNLSLNDQFQLRVGLEYLQLGGGIMILEDDTRFGLWFDDVAFPIKVRDAKVTLHTINLPVLVNFIMYSNDNFAVSIGLGPEVSYLLNATSQETVTGLIGTGIYASYNQTVNETSNYQSFNYAASGNIHLDVPFGGNNLFLECRYRHGFNPVRKGFSYLDIAEIQSDVYQGSFIISLGYKINFSTSNQE